MNNKNWALLLLLAGFWGASFPFTSIALQSMDDIAVVTYRIGLAALFLYIIIRARKWPIPKFGKIWFHFFITGSLMCSIPFSLIVWGQQFVPSGLAAIFNASTAIFGAALAPIFFTDERLRPHKILGIIIGFSGIIVAIGINNLASLSLYNLGQWAIVLATLCYALGGIYGKKFLMGTKPQINALGMVSTAAITMLAALLIQLPTTDYIPDSSGIFAIFYLALIGTSGAYLLYYYLLREIGVSNTTLVTLLIPIFSISLGAIFLHESLHLQDYLGFALLALGLITIDGRIFKRHISSA